MIKHSILAILLSSIALTACAQTKNENTADKATKTQHDPELQKKVQQLVEKTKKNMIFVEGGEYLMGDFGLVTPELEKTVPNSMAVKNPTGNTIQPEGLPFSSSDNNKTPHKVILSSFSMQAHKVSMEDFNIYLAANNLPPSDLNSLYSPEVLHEVAAGMSWQQAKGYCQWLGQQVGIPMDLPTEAQWEFVARNKGQYVLFATNTGNIDSNNTWSQEDYTDYRHMYIPESVINAPVISKTQPNPLGFYDLVTNNYEWMNDWYDKNYYQISPIQNPTGPKTGTEKVLRSTIPMGADNLVMADGINIARTKSLPSPSKDDDLLNYRKFSTRCISNTINK